METLTTHPATAQQASAFTSSNLSFPGGMTPPLEGANASPQKDVENTLGKAAAETPAAAQSVTAGIVPTLQ